MNLEILVLFFVVTCLREGMGIRCYECNSARDPNCGDPFSNQTVADVDCDKLHPGKQATLCRKSVQKVNLGGKSDYRIVRKCGWEPDRKNSPLDVSEDDVVTTGAGGSQCYTRAGTFEVMVTYCSCQEGLCNGVETVMPSMLMGMSVTALGSSAILFMSTLLLF